MGFTTDLLHRFQQENSNGSVVSPISPSTTFYRADDGSYPAGFVYSRASNPNRQQLENMLAYAEGGICALAFSSGMAAINACFQGLEKGDHIILPKQVYYGTKALLVEVFQPLGLEMSIIDMCDLAQLKEALTVKTKLVWLETPSNPTLALTDIADVVALCQHHPAKVAVDNTWCTPLIQRPIMLGADIVMHSSTKYFGGHSDLMGGALIFKDEDVYTEKVKKIQHLAGAIPSPQDCWQICRGLKTLEIRLEKQSQNAFELAQYLEEHPRIEKVHYPGLKSHPQYAIAQRQMHNSYGAMLSIQVGKDANEAMQISTALKYFARATSLGGIESLIEHRKSVEGTYSETPENLLRISVGIEDIEDLKKDWAQALAS